MAKVRIHEIAKESGFESKEILAKALELGINVKTASSSVDEDVAAAIYEYLQTNIIPQGFAKKEEKKEEEKKPSKQKVENKAKKEEKQKQEESKKEPEIEQVQAPQQATQTVSNTLRRGLVIVKKKKDTVVKNEEVVSNKTTKNIDLKDMFSNAQDDSFKKVKKKDKKPNTPQSKKENAQKMDLLSNQNFAEISLEDEDVVVLPEFSTKTEQAPQVLTQKQPSLLRQSFSKFTETSIQRRARKKPPKKPEKKENAEIKSVEIPKEIRVYEFADKLNKNVSEIISKLFMLGMMTTKNDFLDEDAIEILASEFGIEVNIIDEADEFDYLKNYDAKEDNEEDLSPRAPVITIMGHVDHGKTSLLDYIRNSRVANAEAGGITQHVGAYMVEKNKRKITFIDTPGHEAFTAMRARGAGITDIVIIVVAADDGVKPQTKEAINHAKAANVPIIIAINKIDKEGANVDMVKTQLSELDIVPTEWGGSYEFVQVSAKKGTGVDDLLELVLLQADILELKANSKAKAKASIIESSLQKGRGPVATVIVQNGTLKIGNTVVAGVAYGKVRALNDDRGNALKEIKPGECGVIVGLSEIAQAGETLIAVQSDKEAREYAAKRYEYNRQKELSKSTKVSIDELSTKIKEGNLKSLPVILKADVQGSLEAIKSSLEKLVNDEIKVNIIHSGIGGISQSDIELASASENSVVLGFNVRPTGEIKEKAKDKGIEIKTYNVIYNLIDDVKALLSGMMSPIISEEQLGQAEIRQVISVPKIGLIAGCMVSEGVINRGAKIRLIRDGVVLFEGSVSSLKRFKDDVKEVAKGFECGVGIEGCTDMKVGDYIESYKEISQMASI
ncbi:translation initiation factor IF-2 [Campylobacter avium]|uniref:translation initiation factor IF-2 n=1 Tax=Campylobacter avium TaxID=522485 RepID=UPI002356041B|nr:translation initiation factor IF-2 [Campylobacter avium]